MDFAQPNFDKLFNLDLPVFAQAKEFNDLAVKTAKEIAEVQFKAARTILDYTTASVTLPQATDASELLTAQVERTSKLAESLGDSAKAVYEIAESARDVALATFMPAAK